MIEARKFDRHFDEAKLWQWRDGDLTEVERTEVRSHLENCASCQRRAEALDRLLNTIQKNHRAVQPTLAEQMQLMRALEKHLISEFMPNVLVNASRWLLRWLVPAVAILATLFVLLRQETSTAENSLASLLPETAESRLLLVSSDDQLQEAMWELALGDEESQK